MKTNVFFPHKGRKDLCSIDTGKLLYFDKISSITLLRERRGFKRDAILLLNSDKGRDILSPVRKPERTVISCFAKSPLDFRVVKTSKI